MWEDPSGGASKLSHCKRRAVSGRVVTEARVVVSRTALGLGVTVYVCACVYTHVYDIYRTYVVTYKHAHVDTSVRLGALLTRVSIVQWSNQDAPGWRRPQIPEKFCVPDQVFMGHGGRMAYRMVVVSSNSGQF